MNPKIEQYVTETFDYTREQRLAFVANTIADATEKRAYYEAMLEKCRNNIEWFNKPLCEWQAQAALPSLAAAMDYRKKARARTGTLYVMLDELLAERNGKTRHSGEMQELTEAVRPLIEKAERAQEARKLGGQNKTPCIGILALVKQELLHNRKASNKDILESIPLARGDDTRTVITSDHGDYDIYRDGQNIIQIGSRNDSRSIARSTFPNYVTRARKELFHK